ncbi:MAG: GerMN domain-containing protein [Spirochaetia bacterium]
MFRNIDFILDMRLRGKAAVVGYIILGSLLVSVLAFLLVGNRRAERILYFPSERGNGFVTEPRFLTRHWGLEGNITELVNGVLLGPARPDAARLFPRGATVRAVMVRGHTLYLDLTSAVLETDPEVPLTGDNALDALGKSIRLNFPRVHEIVVYIDGQVPRFPAKKNI